MEVGDCVGDVVPHLVRDGGNASRKRGLSLARPNLKATFASCTSCRASTARFMGPNPTQSPSWPGSWSAPTRPPSPPTSSALRPASTQTHHSSGRRRPHHRNTTATTSTMSRRRTWPTSSRGGPRTPRGGRRPATSTSPPQQRPALDRHQDSARETTGPPTGRFTARACRRPLRRLKTTQRWQGRPRRAS